MDILELRGTGLFISAFLNLLLALFLWQRSKKRKDIFWLSITALFSGFYAICCGGVYFFWRPDSITSVLWSRSTWFGVLMLPPFVLFTYYFTGKIKRIKLKALVLYLGAVLISYLAFTTTLFIKLAHLRYPHISGVAGPLDPLGRLFIFVCIIIGLINLLKGYFKSVGFKKLQIKYFITGIIIYALAGTIFTAIIPLLTGESAYYDFTAYFSLIWIGLTSYAITRYRLFEIQVILTDLLVGIMGIILLVSPFLMPTSLLRILTAFIFLLFCIFGYLLIKATYKEIKGREEAERFKKASVKLKERIIQVLDLEKVIFNIAETLIEIFKIDKISFALKQPTSEFYQFLKTIGFGEKGLASIIRDTALCFYLGKIRKPLAKEELSAIIEKEEDKKEKEELKIIQAKMKKNKVDLFFPLFQKQNPIGIIFLGERLSKIPYSKEDIDLLESLSYQVSISINNALLYQEIKKDKEVLEKFYKLIVGRELRMVELKKKIKELEERLRGEEE